MADLSALDSFAGLNDDVVQDSNFQEIEIGRIDEGANVGRSQYDQKKLDELAETIKARGVKSPISVHLHPTEEGRYIVNYGHRRLRASKIAGKDTIPAVIDEDFDVLDQAVENIQREDLDAVGIASIIEQASKQGNSKSEIAQRLGKPKSYVSDYATFFELPDDIRALYNEGLCTSMRILAMLQRAFKKWPTEVTEYCREGSEFTASAVGRLTDFLKEQEGRSSGGENKQEQDSESLDGRTGDSQQVVQGDEQDQKDGDDTEANIGNGDAVMIDGLERDEGEKATSGEVKDDETGEKDETGKSGPGTEDDQPSLLQQPMLENPRIEVSVHGYQHASTGRAGELVMRPSEQGELWVQFEDDGTLELVKSSRVVVVDIVERV